MSYCKFCGNNPPTHDDVCDNCHKMISGDGVLCAAKDAFDFILERNSLCCCGIVVKRVIRERPSEREELLGLPDTLNLPEHVMKAILTTDIMEYVDVSHLFLHPKHCDCSTEVVEVECGINLYAGHARCYWIFDNDRAGFCEGREYGPEIPYSLGEDNFYNAIFAVLNQAAKYAEDCGVRSCPHCGDHHHEDFPCTCRQDDGEEDEQDEADATL